MHCLAEYNFALRKVSVNSIEISFKF